MLRNLIVVLFAGAADAWKPPLPHYKPVSEPCFSNASGEDIYQDVSLRGKLAVVTGSNSGIGLETARALAMRGATVVMACRNATRINEAILNIKETVPDADLIAPESLLDLASFAKVRAFAEEMQQYPAIDILVNNAAMDNNPHRHMTIDGLEMAFQVDYPSTWLLTTLLLPKLRSAEGGGRIVNLVSQAFSMACQMANRHDCVDIDRLPPPAIKEDSTVMGIPPTNYGIARLLMIRWTEDLAEREAASHTGVTAYTVDPGFVNTSMAKKSNLSPFFQVMTWASQCREGSPCPKTAGQGALTPVYLAMNPCRDSLVSGAFYQWCDTVEVRNCLELKDGLTPDRTGLKCPGESQEYKSALSDITASWTGNYSAPFVLDAAQARDLQELEVFEAGGKCPLLLQPLCALVKEAGCFKSCLPHIKACFSDGGCRSSMAESIPCTARMMLQNKSAVEQLACFVPDNRLRNNLFFCMLDEHSCIHPSPDDTKYPECRETEILGDRNFSKVNMFGDWWKVRGWMSGEQYECRACGKVQFWDYSTCSPLPWPQPLPPVEAESDYVVMSSTWLEADAKGKLWTINDTSLFGARSGRAGFPARQQHIGAMYGLSYQENFTVVYDGSQEAEPFVFLYGCGGTVQGSYVTGFVLAKTPVASLALNARIEVVAKENGFAYDGNWCEVDNSCAATFSDIMV